MKLQVAFQMDPITGVDLTADTTFRLAEEAQNRGHRIFYYNPENLTYDNGRIIARGNEIKINRKVEPAVKLGSDIILDLEKDIDMVWLRQDPPFDMLYITTTFLLERVRESTLVINDPYWVRNSPEKLMILNFKNLMPPTIITRNLEAIIEFRNEHKDIILKPLYGNGGNSIFFLDRKDKNFNSLIEIFLDNHPEQFILQEYLKNIKFGDKRIILINGKPEGAINRIPSEKDISANLHVGGEAAKTVISNKEMEICESIGPELIQRGLLLVGIDIIGNKLTEINVTSPTGFREVQKFSNINLAEKLIDSLT